MVKTRKGYLDLSPRFFWLVNSVSPRAAQPSPVFFSLEWLIWGWCCCCFLSYPLLFSLFFSLERLIWGADCYCCCWCCCFLFFLSLFLTLFSLFFPLERLICCRCCWCFCCFFFFSLWKGWSKVDANLCRLLSGGAENSELCPGLIPLFQIGQR